MEIKSNFVEVGQESRAKLFPIYRLLGNPDSIKYFDPRSLQYDAEELECRFVYMALGTLIEFPNLRVLNLHNVTSLGQDQRQQVQGYSKLFLLERLSLSLEPRFGESLEDGAARLINEASALLP
jgi:hypothetical protein